MKVELTVEEAVRLHSLAEIVGSPDVDLGGDAKSIYLTAARKLRGAIERAGGRLEGDIWTVPTRRTR